MTTGDSPALAKAARTEPRTARGRQTLRKLLDAAAIEFGEKGFHEASITAITSRAGTALGSFYTYFSSKDEIFQELVRDLSDKVRDAAREALTEQVRQDDDAFATERAALLGFLRFARQHKEVYRIIDEAEFVDPASFRSHYETTAQRIHERLIAGSAAGDFRADVSEAHAWAIMGMNVFLGLRYAVWNEDDLPPETVATLANDMLQRGLAAKGE